jgi:hypothetical protein
MKPGFAWEIRARICRRDIADEPVARIATLTRIGRDFILFTGMCDNRRQSARKREENIRLLRNGQKDGLRSRDTMLPEHVLYLAELLPD